MSKQYDPEDPIAMDKWMRTYYDIDADEETDAYLIRTGLLEDTVDGLVRRLEMAYAWIEPQATQQTQPIIDQIKAILDEFKGRTSAGYRYHRRLLVEHSEHVKVADWMPGQPIIMPQRNPTPLPMAVPLPLTNADIPQLEKGRLLFEQAKALHRLQPVEQAQEKYRQSQRERATKSGKLTEAQRKRIAERYWQHHAEGSTYGVPKSLAREYGVTPATIRACANKYKPDSIEK